MARPKTPYIRVYKMGCHWVSFIGRKAPGRRWTSDHDLERLIALAVKTFPGEEVQPPCPADIAAGLEPDTYDALDAVSDWLEANPKAAPELLSYVRRALHADTTAVRHCYEEPIQRPADVAAGLGIAEMYLDRAA